MTNEDALKILYRLEINERLDTIEKIDAIIKGIVALNKQIKKKPQGGGNKYCGVCICGNEVVSTSYYCEKCGQAIDWSEEE